MSSFPCTLSVDQISIFRCFYHSRCTNAVDEGPNGEDVYCGQLINYHHSNNSNNFPGHIGGEDPSHMSIFQGCTNVSMVAPATAAPAGECPSSGAPAHISCLSASIPGGINFFRDGAYSSSDVETPATSAPNIAGPRTKKRVARSTKNWRLAKLIDMLDVMHLLQEDRQDLGTDYKRLLKCARKYPAAADFKANHKSFVPSKDS